MPKTRLLAPLFAAALIAGCADMPGMPGASPSPASSPAGGGNTPATGNNGGSTNAGAAFYTEGKMWEYNIATSVAGQNTSGTMKIEVSKVTGDKATLTVSSNMGGTNTSHSTEVNVNEPGGVANTQAQGDITPTKVGMESVTVPAGTFNAEKWTYASSDENGEGTGTYWLAEGIGMVKQVQTIKPKNAPSVPGMNLDLSSTTTLELKSYK